MARKLSFPLIALTTILCVFAFFHVRADAAASAKKKAFVISHFHYDPIWTNSQAGETLRAFAIIHQQLEFADQEPRFKFVLSEIDYLKPYWDAYPRDRERLLKLARAGRIDFTGGYNEPDEASVGGEALIRNFAFGALFKESTFGTRPGSAAQFDVFGHAAQLPQILLGTGHDYALFSRGIMLDMPSEFYWLSPDGSSVLTKQIDYYDILGKTAFFAADNHFYGLTNNGMFMSGGDFREPERGMSAALKNNKYIEMKSATTGEFFKAVLADLKGSGKAAPEISRDHTPIFAGCYTSRIDTKLANRRIENLLADAEKFSTLYSIQSGEPYPAEQLDTAWRMLFFGEHHDALTGSDHENANLDLLTGWHEAMRIADSALTRSITGLTREIDTYSAAPAAGRPTAIVIFNSLNWDRTGPVQAEINPPALPAFKIIDSNGKPVPFQFTSPDVAPPYTPARVLIAPPDVPSLGYRVLYAVLSDKFPDGTIPQAATGTVIENDMYRIEVDPKRGGGIKSIYAKKQDREFIDSSAGTGNEIYAIEERIGSSPWDLNATGKNWRGSDHPAESVVIERGAVCSKITVTNAPRVEDAGKRGKVEVIPRTISEIRICDGSPRIDFATHFLDYKAKDILFKVGFPANLTNVAPIYEERFSAIARERHPLAPLFYNESAGQIGEHPANFWAGLSPSTSLNFTGASGQTVSQFPLTYGEIVIPNGDNDAMKLSNRLAESLIKAGVTTAPTADDKKRTNNYYGFRISLGWGGNNAYTAELLTSINPSLRAQLASAVEKNGVGFLFIETPGSVTSTPDHRSIPILIVQAATREKLEAAIDDFSRQLNSRQAISLPAECNATSFKALMDTAGLALINNGQSGYSVERPNTIMLSLMRSSTGSPAGRQYSDNWETENWNHIFHYALLPHSGNWSAADVPRAGYEFNFPLIPVESKLHPGELPTGSFSFLNTGDANVILSSLKPAGFPIPENKSTEFDRRNLSIRMYNPTMSATSGEMTLNRKVDGTHEADFLDREQKALTLADNSFRFYLSQFKIQTYLVALKPVSLPPAPQAAAATASFPVYSRYWETGQDAAPEGFIPLSVVLEPGAVAEDGKSMKLRVTLAGNLNKSGFSGDLKFTLPDGASIKGDTKYDLPPLGVKAFDFSVTGLDPAKLHKQFIAVTADAKGKQYNDVLTFSNWKVFRGELKNGAEPSIDDSSWQALPLARFWSSAATAPGATWYRRKVFIPKGFNDAQMLFERPAGGEIEAYVNGTLVRREKQGVSYEPLINKKTIKEGEDNLIAVKFTAKDSDSPAWGLSFRGSEALFNKSNWMYSHDKLELKPGEESSFSVELMNPFAQAITGQAVLMSPIETWAEGGPYSLISITPDAQQYSMDANGGTSVTFKVKVPPDALPGSHIAAVKLIFNGITTYTDTFRITVK